MKKFVIALFSAFLLSSCVVYADPPVAGNVVEGCTTFCDDYGCREVCGQYYVTPEGYVVYWDAHFGCWIGPHGYWSHGVFYHGYYPGYHGWYHQGWYHGGYHGGYHGYHGGHRR